MIGVIGGQVTRNWIAFPWQHALLGRSRMGHARAGTQPALRRAAVGGVAHGYAGLWRPAMITNVKQRSATIGVGRHVPFAEIGRQRP